jgi:hypothetical protein
MHLVAFKAHAGNGHISEVVSVLEFSAFFVTLGTVEICVIDIRGKLSIVVV